MHYAASSDQIDAIKVLLDAGADIHARGMAGGTALHRAAIAGQFHAVKVLLEAGADVNARDESRETPLMKAWEGSPKILGMQLLPVSGADKMRVERLLKDAGAEE